MPVRSTDLINPMGLMDDLGGDMLADVIAALPSTEPVLSEDIWKKFELDFPELTGLDDIFDEMDTDGDTFLPFLAGICPIRNHDCMWAGHCASKEHPADEPRIHMYCAINSIAPGAPKAPVPTIKRENNAKPPAACQQSLLKPAVRAAASAAPLVPPVHTPQTPPMSDDEETKCKPTQVLQILNQTISECDLDEDSDLCDYREEFFDEGDDDEDMEVNVTDSGPAVKEAANPNIRSCQFAAESDHSYHKDKNASMLLMPNLGIDTPSDSEEEIDVVSVTGEKTTINNRICTLPTNPSIRDRQQIQRRMATAISKNRINGIKTILPVRKTSTENSQIKRKLPESRVAKRTRQYRSTSTNSPYKRRSLGNSSDSEAEPSEKRSLHNNMERQRRIDLRNAFEDLRLLIPEVSKKEKAAKVVILREAAKYCYHLGNVSLDCTNQLSDLRREQEQLRRRVSQLRRSLAATR